MPQHEIEEHPARRKLAAIPDLRAYFVNDRGERGAGLRRDGHGRRGARRQARKIQSEMAETGKFRAVTSNAALDRPEVIIEPDLASAGRTRHLDGGDLRDAARRHHGRHRREPGQVHRRRPADPDPRAVDREARATIIAVVRHAAACRRRPACTVPLSSVANDRASARARRRSTASTVSGASSSAPTWRRAPELSEGLGAVVAAAGGEGHAGRRAHPGDRRRRDDGRGASPASPPPCATGLMLVLVVLILLLRLGVPLLHHPGLAAAGGRRRGGRASRRPIRRSRCRWSSAS